MTCKTTSFFVAFIGLLITYTPANAAQTEIKSCYNLVNLDDVAIPTKKRELIIAVDQTVEFDKSVQEHTFKKIQQFLRPGDNVKLITFSAYVQGNFTDILFSGQLDSQLDDEVRYDISKKSLKSLDHCYSLQNKAVREGVGKTLLTAFSNASSKVPNTELIDNLSLISKTLYNDATIEKRYLLIVSDMMEHSSLTSFYKSGSLKKLSPEIELSKIQKAGLEFDLKQANVFVIGAAYSKNGKYRSGEEIRNFTTFWQQFFQQSNATLNSFGTPILLQDIE